MPCRDCERPPNAHRSLLADVSGQADSLVMVTQEDSWVHDFLGLGPPPVTVKVCTQWGLQGYGVSYC